MKKEVLRLFKSYLGEKSESLWEDGLKYGLLIPDTADKEIVDEAIKQYGKDGKKWNETFHKDFEIVKNAPIEDLIAQQIIHYITTYGFESLGLYDSDLVYIPNEKLEIPGLDKDSGVEFITIKPITENELTEKLMVLLTSGIALSEQTIKDIMVLSDYIDKDRFDEISNREIKTALYDKYNIMPRNPEEFLRFLIFKTTRNTLKIQDDNTINSIKDCDKKMAFRMLKSYIDNTPNGYSKLSSIFLRNKNLFLAFKNKDGNKEINTIINKLRKLAIKNHKPLKKNILDCLTDENADINLTSLQEELNNITIFREIRIINGILYRLKGTENIVYKIRNGKSYFKKLNDPKTKYIERLEYLYKAIYNHLKNRVSLKVKDKIIYIPDNITYAALTSEKQFNGNIPEGSYLEIPRGEDLVYGVHWTNILNGTNRESSYYGEMPKRCSEERVDLDLKQMNKSEIFGWDASYRSKSGNILFSGDVTDAPNPNGATELFYVDKNYGYGAFLITLNMFTGNSQDVPFEFVIAKGDGTNVRKNYVINPNNILEKIDMTIKKSERQMVVGFISIGETIKFYFNDFSAGASVRTSRQDDITLGAFDYLQAYSKVQLKLNDLLKDSGAKIINEPTYKKLVVTVDEEGNEVSQEEKEVPVDIDLSTSAITKETLIDLLS